MTRRAGIDVGGTKCLGVVVDDEGRILAEARHSTPRGDLAIVEELVRLARSLGQYDSLGVGVPGLITKEGVIRASPNLMDVQDLFLADALRQRLGHDVHVDNDATCAAAAEWQVGAGMGTRDMVMVTLGTGIGGGLVSEGSLVRGRNGFAGEIGHMVVDPDGPLCPCGQHGCWERYASGSGLAWLAQQAAAENGMERVVKLAGGDVAAIRGEHVQVAAARGDADALEVIDEFGRWVAIGLANLTNLLDPELFVLGGGLAAGSEVYIGPISAWFSQLLYSPRLRPHPAVRFATLGPRAGAIGAAMLATVH